MELPPRTPAQKVKDKCEACRRRPSNAGQIAEIQKALDGALAGKGSSHKGKSTDKRGKYGGSGGGTSKGKGKSKA
jgi:hypothetical protein